MNRADSQVSDCALFGKCDRILAFRQKMQNPDSHQSSAFLLIKNMSAKITDFSKLSIPLVDNNTAICLDISYHII